MIINWCYVSEQISGHICNVGIQKATWSYNLLGGSLYFYNITTAIFIKKNIEQPQNFEHKIRNILKN